MLLSRQVRVLEWTLREKCPNKDQKKLRIWTLFAQWNLHSIFGWMSRNPLLEAGAIFDVRLRTKWFWVQISSQFSNSYFFVRLNMWWKVFSINKKRYDVFYAIQLNLFPRQIFTLLLINETNNLFLVCYDLILNKIKEHAFPLLPNTPLFFKIHYFKCWKLKGFLSREGYLPK